MTTRQLATNRFMAGEKSSMNFSSNSHYIACGAINAFYNNAFTFSCYIKLTDLGTTKAIIGWSTNSTPEFRIVGTNQINITKQNVINMATSSYVLKANKWYFVAVTYDSSGNYVFYISDFNMSPTVFGSGTNLQTWNFSSGILYIGNVVGFASSGNKTMKNLKIFNRALTSSEIIKAYYENLTNSIDGIVAQYLFDEQSGTTAIDRINGYNGTLHGSSYSTDILFPARTLRT